jgi:hypothetical protein
MAGRVFFSAFGARCKRGEQSERFVVRKRLAARSAGQIFLQFARIDLR